MFGGLMVSAGAIIDRPQLYPYQTSQVLIHRRYFQNLANLDFIRVGHIVRLHY